MIGIVESARRAGRAEAWSRALFETVGRWVPDEPDATAKLLFALGSRRHAEDADRWARLVPVLHDVDPTSPMPDGVAALQRAGDEGTVARLAAYGDAVEALDAELASWEAEAMPESEGPMLRLIGLVRVDLAASRGAIAAVVTGLEGSRAS